MTERPIRDVQSPKNFTAFAHHNYWRELYPRRQCEWMLSVIMLAAGLVYVFADELFRLPLYEAQAHLLPRMAWAAILITVGSLRLTFLAINGFYRRSPHWRALGSGLACLTWLELSFAAAQSPVAGATLAIWPVFFWFDLKAALNAAGEARTSDDLCSHQAGVNDADGAGAH